MWQTGIQRPGDRRFMSGHRRWVARRSRAQTQSAGPSALCFTRSGHRCARRSSHGASASFWTPASGTVVLGRSSQPGRGTAYVCRIPLVRHTGRGYSGRDISAASSGGVRMDEKFWYLKNCSLFECLSDEHVRRLESRAKSRAFKRGSLVYVPTDLGDCVLLLTSGRVKIFHNTQDGKQAVLALIDPGELFGELAIATFEDGQREEHAEAMEASTIVAIPAEDSERLVHLLFDLAEKYGRYTKEGGIALSIHLSHQELANIIGSTRETVTLV